ncbi:MAG TPA: hypothetical protein VIL79_09575 [Thermoleophilia bacterium]
MIVASAAVAAVAGRPVWAAVLGSSLALLYWAIEALTWRRARERHDLALGLAVGGMTLRLGVVMAVLVLVGVLARPAFATVAIAFLAGFTVYLGVRPFIFTPAPTPSGQARARG